jgi:hypothetical protein
MALPAAFADVNHLRLPKLRGGVSSERDENSGNRVDAERHQAGNRARHRKCPGRQLRFSEKNETGKRRDKNQDLLRALRAEQHDQDKARA